MAKFNKLLNLAKKKKYFKLTSYMAHQQKNHMSAVPRLWVGKQ